MSNNAVMIAAVVLVGTLGCHSTPPRAGDAEPQLPILFDYRQLAGSEDLSGLPAGTHTVSFDAYISTSRGMAWGPGTFDAVEKAVRIAHASTHSRPNYRVTFDDVLGRADVRRVSITATLDAPGTWVFDFRSGGMFLPVHRKDGYDIANPETLRDLGDIALASTPILLRTVGSCNHVTRVELEKDASGAPAARLTFSESTEPSFLTVLGHDATARVDFPLAADADPSSNRAVVVHLSKTASGAEVSGSVGSVTIKGSDKHDGAFLSTLSCAPGDYTISNLSIQPETPIVSPLYEAVEAAFPEHK